MLIFGLARPHNAVLNILYIQNGKKQTLLNLQENTVFGRFGSMEHSKNIVFIMVCGVSYLGAIWRDKMFRLAK